MTHYNEQSTTWMKLKALEFFLNFIRNHKGSIEDNEVFSLVAELESRSALLRRIQSTFSANKLQQLQNGDYRRDRLDFEDAPQEILREIWSAESCRPTFCRMLTALVDDYRKSLDGADFSGEFFPQKLEELKRTFSLSVFETEVLLVFIFLHNELLTIEDRHQHCTNEADKITFVAKCLNCDTANVLQTVFESEKLRRYQCLDNDLDLNCHIYGFFTGINNTPLINRFFKQQKTEVLPWEFYGELATRHGAILKEIIRAGKGKSNVNILLYGAPGTGKTSFAGTLAAELGLNCYFINQNSVDDKNADSSPEYRFCALQICSNQVDSAHSLIVVDEADDMLRSTFLRFGSSGRGDKGMLNSVLDNIKTPTIWITNTPAGALDESSRRRFDYSIRFDPLSSTQRLAIWNNNVKKMQLEELFNPAMLEEFSKRYAVSAGGITLTLQNVARLAPAKNEVAALVDRLLVPHCELLEIPTSLPKFAPARDYSLKGLNIKGEISLERIITAVRNFQNAPDGGMDRPRMNLLLSGAPGTGKTEFVKYLGKELDTRVTVKMGSDLLSMWVGETEQNIRQAFAQAEAEHAILFFDEIDGLLRSRELANQSWEVSQVNELLHQMENFSGVMIGATNFTANLDAAVLRRFTFKLEFDFLDESGKLFFFERMFQTVLSETEKRRLAAIPYLTPGDFRTVRQSLFYLGSDTTNVERLSALEAECRTKSQNRFAQKNRMGF